MNKNNILIVTYFIELRSLLLCVNIAHDVLLCCTRPASIYRIHNIKLVSTKASKLYIRKAGIQLSCGRFEYQWLVAVLLKMTCVKVKS